MSRVYELKCEYKTNPLCIDVIPRFSWKLDSEKQNITQASFTLTACADRPGAVAWVHGEQSDRTVHVEYAGPALMSNTRYIYKVVAVLNDGEVVSSDGSDYFETGLLRPDAWQAQWIANAEESELGQCSIFRKELLLDKPVKRARIYASATGLYELYLNGETVGEYVLSPGYTSYAHQLPYQCFDVTAALQQGINAIGIRLGDGWYCGEFSFNHQTRIYGEQPTALLQLMIEYADGTACFVTDDSWTCARGGVVFSGLYDGETYDATKEAKGWHMPGFSDPSWQKARVCPAPKGILTGMVNEGTKRIEEIQPVSIFQTPKGETVLDMGQNMVGWVKVSLAGKRGDLVHLKHFEVLDKDGNCYFDNIRLAKQETQYILSGEGKEVFEPHFTFQGFRYVQVIAFPGKPKPENFTGVVVHTDMEQTAQFTCSDPMINQLWHNILWGQKGNFLDIPTDCPQRDERLGWTGDAQVFCRTASFNYLSDAFFTKWLADVRADQFSTGAIPFVVPNVLPEDWRFLVECDLGYEQVSAGWGDAITICPWTLYQCYGDIRVLKENYDAMKRYIAYIYDGCDHGSGNPYLWDWGPQLGDWLALDSEEGSYYGGTDEYLVATAYYAYSTKIVAKCASLLNEAEDAAYYQALYAQIVACFEETYMKDGKMAQDTQTAHVLPLAFGLLSDEKSKSVAARLVELIEQNNNHLTTGFLGTPYLCQVLSDFGYTETAYRLLMNKDFPSWLYQITKGATTIWEHWDGIKEDGTFWSANMNSFNHYAYGAIGDWLYRNIAGIEIDESKPAYKHIVIRPRTNPALTHASCEYNSIHGPIKSSWEVRGRDVCYRIEIPANTTATVVLLGDTRVLGSGTYEFFGEV